MASETLLTTAQAASILGRKPQTLRKWRWKGWGPAYIRMGETPFSQVSYRRRDILRWLESRTFLSASEEKKEKTEPASP